MAGSLRGAIVNFLVNYKTLDAALSALADPTRRQIVEQLAQGDASISQLAAPHHMTMPAILKHLGKLADAGLVTRAKQGRVVTCRLNPEPLDEASRWLDEHLQFWNKSLDALGTFIEKGRKKRK